MISQLTNVDINSSSLLEILEKERIECRKCSHHNVFHMIQYLFASVSALSTSYYYIFRVLHILNMLLLIGSNVTSICFCLCVRYFMFHIVQPCGPGYRPIHSYLYVCFHLLFTEIHHFSGQYAISRPYSHLQGI